MGAAVTLLFLFPVVLILIMFLIGFLFGSRKCTYCGGEVIKNIYAAQEGIDSKRFKCIRCGKKW